MFIPTPATCSKELVEKWNYRRTEEQFKPTMLPLQLCVTEVCKSSKQSFIKHFTLCMLYVFIATLS